MLGPLVAIVTDENGHSKYPWWIRAVQMVGVPAVVSFILLWWVLTVLSTRLDAMAVEQSAMFRLLQQICVNTSASVDQRNACWNPWSRP